MDPTEGTNDIAGQDTGAATSTLKKVSKKLVDSAPDEGPLADAAVRVASGLESADERIRNFDMSKVGPAIRGLPWGMIGGVALAAGGLALAFNKNARRSVVSRVDDLLDTSFGDSGTSSQQGKSRGKSRSGGSRSQKGKAH